ncbi:hypothetical protein BDZ91DRAFT_807898 [Kalaharituber pfeilii]|nr:hypothetical protein BDZ91DRAFT_807898 [Kalaharituber pfeilii]
MDQTLEYLRSSFKIVLKNPNGADDGAAVANLPQEKPEFYVHRKLLASLSPELDRHANNHMKEGLEDVMELSEVDEPTIKAFLDPHPNTAPGLFEHTKVYVLADHFNTPILKELAYSRITALLVDLGMITESGDIEVLLVTITYAFVSLPLSTLNTTSPSAIVAPSEKLLRQRTEFGELLHCADFARALVSFSQGTPTPPWITSMDEDFVTPVILEGWRV